MRHFFTNKWKLIRFSGYWFLAIIMTYCSSEEDYDIYESLSYATNSFKKSDQASIDFLVLSDWGFNGSADQISVASEMAHISNMTRMDFVLTCGDNFQKTGVEFADDYLWQINYENIYSDSSLTIPWYPALGNHDYMGNPQAQVEYSQLNENWKMPSRYYTFVKKIDSLTSARFIVLDTPGMINDYRILAGSDENISVPQVEWFKKTLSEAKEKWIIVTGHHPVQSASSYHGDSKEMNKLIKPLMEKYGVDFYICGHDHHFEHSKDRNSSIEYIITGTGGETRPVGFDFRSVITISSLGFTFLSIMKNQARLYFITNEGKIGYQYGLNK